MNIRETVEAAHRSFGRLIDGESTDPRADVEIYLAHEAVHMRYLLALPEDQTTAEERELYTRKLAYAESVLLAADPLEVFAQGMILILPGGDIEKHMKGYLEIE